MSSKNNIRKKNLLQMNSIVLEKSIEMEYMTLREGPHSNSLDIVIHNDGLKMNAFIESTQLDDYEALVDNHIMSIIFGNCLVKRGLICSMIN